MPIRFLPRFARRHLRRLLPSSRRRRDVVYSRLYAQGHSAVPADPFRGEQILTYLASEGLCPGTQVQTPLKAPIHHLRRVHSDDYLDSLHDEEVLTRTVGISFGLKELDDFLEVQRAMVGGTLLATARAIESGGLAVNLGGGLHHALADRGQGFCLLNDVAVAIAEQRDQGFDGRILVVDLDLHHGDGTEVIFAEDSSVYTFSIHNRHWSEIEAVASTRIELGHEVGDDVYLETVYRHLPPILDTFRPDLAFFLAGADPAETDTLGDWTISRPAMLERDLFVLNLLRRGEHRIPTVLLLAGGYGKEAWSYPAATLGAWWYPGNRSRGEISASRALKLPSTDEITLLRYRMMAQMLDPAELTGTDGDFGLSEEDLFGPLGGPARSTRFLDFYAKTGIELVLERSGLLRELRRRGFPHVHLEWDLDADSGDTLRLFGSPGRGELLAELRVRRERRLIPGMKLLHVEWLLLQNPRKQLSRDNPGLPGQEHPGLGLLRDVVALLAVLGDRLRLDGISFVPAHFHLAATSRKMMRFLDPGAAARMRGVQRAIRELDLREASRAVAEERVIEVATGEPYRWEPTPLVIPLSDALKDRLDSRARRPEGPSTEDQGPRSDGDSAEFRLLPSAES